VKFFNAPKGHGFTAADARGPKAVKPQAE